MNNVVSNQIIRINPAEVEVGDYLHARLTVSNDTCDRNLGKSIKLYVIAVHSNTETGETEITTTIDLFKFKTGEYASVYEK